jgi:PRTRC genetic system protein E
MFTELFPVTASTRLAMLISADAGRGTMTVSVMPRPAQNAAQSICRDLTLTATPEELDAGFVAALSSYREKLLPLMEQVAAANKALEAVQAAHAAIPKASKTTLKAATPAKKPSDTAPPRCAAVDDGDEPVNPNEDPDRDWMKNRQPELF